MEIKYNKGENGNIFPFYRIMLFKLFMLLDPLREFYEVGDGELLGTH